MFCEWTGGGKRVYKEKKLLYNKFINYHSRITGKGETIMANGEIEIDLLKIVKTWLKKAWIIILVAAILRVGILS